MSRNNADLTGVNTLENAPWNQIFKRAEKKSGVTTINLGVIGNSNVGKTSLCRKFSRKLTKTSAKIATIGVDVEYVYLHAFNDTLKIKIWDTAGQERFRAVGNQYVRNLDGVVLVFDMTDL